MPRIPRGTQDDTIYHVLNRGNHGQVLFSDEEDYAGFLGLIRDLQGRIPTRILSYCLMPEHWHLLLWPSSGKDLSRFMHLLSMTHTLRFHSKKGRIGSGHLYQGRYKSFPVEKSDYLLHVSKYIERNPLRKGLCSNAEKWEWNSLYQVTYHGNDRYVPILETRPLQSPERWLDFVNAKQDEQELKQLRACVNRGRPYGSNEWVERKARELGLAQTLRPRGRPKKERSGSDRNGDQHAQVAKKK